MEPIKKPSLDGLLHELHNQTYVWLLLLPLASFVTSHKLFKQSKSKLPHLENDSVYICFAGFYED